jgi:hypothetical protein
MMKLKETQLTGQVLAWSYHAQQRQQQRGFQPLDAILLQAFGEPVEDGYLMSGKSVSEARRLLKTMIQRLNHINGNVLIETSGTVITTFRADKKRIRRLREGHVKTA